MRALCILLGLCLLAESGVAADNSSVWDAWERQSQRMCPSRHVTWVADGGYLDLIEAFEASLSQSTRRHVLAAADYPHKCTAEKLGFGCEMGVALDTYRYLGLFPRFVEYSCRHVRCEETSLCSEMPRAPPGKLVSSTT